MRYAVAIPGNGRDRNAFIISYLLDMQPVEAAELIEQAHAADCVNASVNGNGNKVHQELGIVGLGLVPEALARIRPFPSFLPPVSEPGSESSPKARRDDSATLQLSGTVGRNVPCPCGSGKKYNKCCGP